MEFCHIVWTMTHGEKVAEPCEMAGICERVEGRFTGIRTDIGKLEMELLKAHDWSARVQD